jgi:hypothetical protein
MLHCSPMKISSSSARRTEPYQMLESRPMVTEPTTTAPGAIQEPGWIEGAAAPALADPVLADPVLADPVLADPVLADPVLADPVLADPVLADPVLADPVLADPVLADPVLADPRPRWRGGPSDPMSGACDGPADGSVSSASCSTPGPIPTIRSSQIT